MAQSNSPPPKRDINAVLRDHDKELMAIPNVVGVYVGVLGDGPWQDFETKLSFAGTPPYVQVQALDANGAVLGSSAMAR